MNTLLLGLRVLLFALSAFGYLTVLHKKTRLPVEFLPAIVFCGQICVLFAAGILNLLSLSVWLLFGAGLLLAVLSLRDHRLYRDFLCPGYVFFALSCLYFLLMLKGQVFNSYDNFSHWALVVKQMLLTDRFPTFQDPLILFQAYPLGSSSFIYYVCCLISRVSEGCQMFAQVMLSLSMILPLFSCIRKQKFTGIFLMLGSTLFFLSYNTFPSELLVDALLALTGAAALLLLEQELGAEDQTAWLSVLPAVALILIKNSGIFFWALLAGKLIWHACRHGKTASAPARRSWYTVFFAPLLTLLLWKKHVAYVFAAAESSPHSMSLSAYLANMQQKMADGSISRITEAFRQQIIAGRGLLLLLLVLAVFMAACAMHKLSVRPWLGRAVFLTVVYVLYQLGNLCMYLFSMPEGEAVVMAGYGRYYRTIIMFCFAYALFYLLRELDEQKLPLAVIGTLLLLLVYRKLGMSTSILHRTGEYPVRAEMERLMDEYDVEHYQDYLICIPEDDMGYVYHLTKYLLYTPTVDVHVGVSSEDEFADIVNIAIDLEYEYFINLDPENEAIDQYCQKTFGAAPGQQVIRLQ